MSSRNSVSTQNANELGVTAVSDVYVDEKNNTPICMLLCRKQFFSLTWCSNVDALPMFKNQA